MWSKGVSRTRSPREHTRLQQEAGAGAGSWAVGGAGAGPQPHNAEPCCARRPGGGAALAQAREQPQARETGCSSPRVGRLSTGARAALPEFPAQQVHAPAEPCGAGAMWAGLLPPGRGAECAETPTGRVSTGAEGPWAAPLLVAPRGEASESQRPPPAAGGELAPHSGHVLLGLLHPSAAEPGSEKPPSPSWESSAGSAASAGGCGPKGSVRPGPPRAPTCL